jgi:WW domain
MIANQQRRRNSLFEGLDELEEDKKVADHRKEVENQLYVKEQALIHDVHGGGGRRGSVTRSSAPRRASLFDDKGNPLKGPEQDALREKARKKKGYQYIPPTPIEAAHIVADRIVHAPISRFENLPEIRLARSYGNRERWSEVVDVLVRTADGSRAGMSPVDHHDQKALAIYADIMLAVVFRVKMQDFGAVSGVLATAGKDVATLKNTAGTYAALLDSYAVERAIHEAFHFNRVPNAVSYLRNAMSAWKTSVLGACAAFSNNAKDPSAIPFRTFAAGGMPDTGRDEESAIRGGPQRSSSRGFSRAESRGRSREAQKPVSVIVHLIPKDIEHLQPRKEGLVAMLDALAPLVEVPIMMAEDADAPATLDFSFSPRRRDGDDNRRRGAPTPGYAAIEAGIAGQNLYSGSVSTQGDLAFLDVDDDGLGLKSASVMLGSTAEGIPAIENFGTIPGGAISTKTRRTLPASAVQAAKKAAEREAQMQREIEERRRARRQRKAAAAAGGSGVPGSPGADSTGSGGNDSPLVDGTSSGWYYDANTGQYYPIASPGGAGGPQSPYLSRPTTSQGALIRAAPLMQTVQEEGLSPLMALARAQSRHRLNTGGFNGPASPGSPASPSSPPHSPVQNQQRAQAQHQHQHQHQASLLQYSAPGSFHYQQAGDGFAAQAAGANAAAIAISQAQAAEMAAEEARGGYGAILPGRRDSGHALAGSLDGDRAEEEEEREREAAVIASQQAIEDATGLVPSRPGTSQGANGRGRRSTTGPRPPAPASERPLGFSLDGIDPAAANAAAKQMQKIARGRLTRRHLSSSKALEWLPKRDESSGHIYYVHLTTGVTQWQPPSYIKAEDIPFRICCATCSGYPSIATHYCSSCTSAACDSCAEAVHGKGEAVPPSASGYPHSLVPLKGPGGMPDVGGATPDPVCQGCAASLGLYQCLGCGGYILCSGCLAAYHAADPVNSANHQYNYAEGCAGVYQPPWG